MTTLFSINISAVRQVLEQAVQANASGEGIEVLDFLSSGWNPNDYPDSTHIGALLRTVQEIGLIDGERDLRIAYIEENEEGGGSYAFFVDNSRTYDTVRVLSNFGQTGRIVPEGTVGVEAAVDLIELAIERANEALGHLDRRHSKQAPLASQFTVGEVELMLQAALTLYRNASDYDHYLDYPQIQQLDRLALTAGEPEVSFEVGYRLLGIEQTTSSWVPMLATDEDQARERALEWIALNDSRYVEGMTIEIGEIEET